MTKHLYVWAGAVLSMLLSGCSTAGGPTFESQEKPENPPAIYSALGSATCAVMVWTDWQTRSDFARLQIDLARLLQERLTPKPPDEKDKRREPPPSPQFINPALVVRFQREHPDTEGLPITEIAPRLGVARVIYVEVESFQVQAPDSALLLKGHATATLRVVEIDANHKARIVLEEADIKARYPVDAPEGVVVSERHNLRSVYMGTLGRLADKIAARFEQK